MEALSCREQSTGEQWGHRTASAESARGSCKDLTEEVTATLDREDEWGLQAKKQGGSTPGRGHHYMPELGGVRETTAGIK